VNERLSWYNILATCNIFYKDDLCKYIIFLSRFSVILNVKVYTYIHIHTVEMNVHNFVTRLMVCLNLWCSKFVTADN